MLHPFRSFRGPEGIFFISKSRYAYGNKAVPYGCFGDTLSYIHNNRTLMEENKMFENSEMSTDITIAHHWVPMELFNRLGDIPNRERRIDRKLVLALWRLCRMVQTKRNRAICQNGGRRMKEWITCKSGECTTWFNGTSVAFVDSWRKLQTFCKCEVSE